jgi:hypothetical protein
MPARKAEAEAEAMGQHGSGMLNHFLQRRKSQSGPGRHDGGEVPYESGYGIRYDRLSC